MSYWQTYCGYSAETNRLVFTYGQPVAFSQGRAFTVGDSKWTNWGDKLSRVEAIGAGLSGSLVLVEDIISAHKVAQVSPALPLFGTTIANQHISFIKAFNRPVVLWLDADQYLLLPKKIARLQTLLDLPVSSITTTSDPKGLSIKDINNELSRLHSVDYSSKLEG